MKDKNKQLLKSIIFCILVNVVFSNYVYWEPAIPSPGGTIEIFYDSEEGILSDDLSSVFIHLGYNGWQETDDYEMFYQPQIPDGNWFKFIYNIPSDAETIDFVESRWTIYDSDGDITSYKFHRDHRCSYKNIKSFQKHRIAEILDFL